MNKKEIKKKECRHKFTLLDGETINHASMGYDYHRFSIIFCEKCGKKKIYDTKI